MSFKQVYTHNDTSCKSSSCFAKNDIITKEKAIQQNKLETH